MRNPTNIKSGFTLIELSIVLVIIGLIIGGILVGRDLISAAAVRAQISQIEKYQTAVNTFRGKFGYLPGDIPDPTANNYGFVARGTIPGQGDGNGLIEGTDFATQSLGVGQTGENTTFWEDLSSANLIDGGFSTARPTLFQDATQTSSPNLSAFIPTAKLSGGNYVYVYSGGHWNGSNWTKNNTNYFGLSAITESNSGYWATSNPGVTVQQAYAIDKKIDDGMPISGVVIAAYTNIRANNYGASYGGPTYVNPGGLYLLPSGAIKAGPLTCYDNGNSAANSIQYSLEINNGTGINCALSFRFQ